MQGEALRGGHGGNGRQGRLMRLAGWIDLDSRLTVCSKVPLQGCSTDQRARSAAQALF